MIRRSVKIQLVAFALISLLGIFYIGTNYVGIHFLSDGPDRVTVVLAHTGGLFPNAEVTERGVPVGKVATMSVHRDTQTCGQLPTCVVVGLDIDHNKKIPQDVHVSVANLSAVGEQYLDLAPQSSGQPYLQDGSVIQASDATLPIEDSKLLLNLDNLVTSVNRKHLTQVINELGKGFDNLGPALQTLIDRGNELTRTAIANLPQQLKLINDGRRVLDTQNDVAAELKAWAHSFAQFSDQLRTSDPDLRAVFDNGVAASQQLAGLLRDNADALPVLLGNLVTFNQIQAVRLPYVRATLQLFPSVAASGFYVTPGDGTAHFGQVNDNSAPCTTGYQSTKLRGNNDDGQHPSQWGGPANLDAYCHGGQNIAQDQRGSRNVPRPDHAQITNSDPYPGPVYGHSNHPTVAEQRGHGYAGSFAATDTSVALPYDAASGLLTGLDGKTYQLGFDGPLSSVFGSSAWEWLLIAPTMK